MQSVPFYIFGESYGGKWATQFGVALHKGNNKVVNYKETENKIS